MFDPRNDPPDLLATAQSCNQAAENRLFEKLHARFLPLAKRRLRRGGHNPANAADLVQDALFVMLQPDSASLKPQYKIIEHFWPWAFTILRNKIGNEFKKRTRRSLQQALLDVIPCAEEAMRGEWEEAFDGRLKYLLAKMPEKYREIIRALVLRSMGFDLPEHLAKLPRGTWDSLVFRARKKLCRLMEEESLL